MTEAEPNPRIPVSRDSRLSSVVFLRELWFGAGYSLQTPRRGTGCGVYRGGSAHSLGLTIDGFTLLTEELQLVNPFIRIHVVDSETGKYLRSSKFNHTEIPPISTK